MAAQTVLDWIAKLSEPTMVNGKERRHASIEGNALAVCCRLGMAHSRRVRYLVDVLLRSQWSDGGWNCDRDPGAHRSSFHESLAPIWGLVEYHRATGDAQALAAAQRTGDLLLDHGLFRSMRTGNVIDSEWLHVHWPHYWHYDFFHGLRAIAMLGRSRDNRGDDARQRLLDRRRPDGTWRADGHRYWSPATEVVDWGDGHQMVTSAALNILRLTRSLT
jgi:hypothetical protein